MRLAPRRPSIRARLALIYTGLLAVALLAFGSGIYIVLRDELVRSFDRALLANAEHAAGAFGVDVETSGSLRQSDRLVEQFASTGGRVIVMDAAGMVIADSEPGAMPVSWSTAVEEGHTHLVRAAVLEGSGVRWTVEPIQDAEGETQGHVVWASTTAELDELLATVARALLLGGLAVVAVALVLGLVLARRALAPIAGVTETARAISLSGDVAARVQPGDPHDEVGQLAVAFNEMLEALEENHDTLRRFLADASHELRTPLTTIRASLELARRPGVPDDERTAMLRDAAEEVDRMRRLVRDLLGLARAEAGARLEVRPLELDALVLEATRRHRQAAKGVQVRLGAVEPAVVDGDADRLREVLGIVLDNAVRYTPAGGRITVTLEADGRQAAVRVVDTGMGIAPGDRDRVFERLFRGENARRAHPSGSGLGLSIARWIVEQHGGSIELDPGPDGGTVAAVVLPVTSVFADRGRDDGEGGPTPR
jgi:two-component system, OmpR family, sensor kinase